MADEFLLIPDQYIDSTDIYNIMNDKSVLFQYLCINIRSLVNNSNFSKLEAFLFSLNFRPDIIAVIETWIQPSSKGTFKNLKGYNFISNNRIMHQGGGVEIYVKDNISFSFCDELTIMEEKFFASIFTKAIFRRFSIKVAYVHFLKNSLFDIF